jgi:penicillin V acylase-like amidase (Ntn superfamily)
MCPQRFFRLFAGKERGRTAKKKTTLVCETLERRLALASVSTADPSVVLIDAALMVDIPRQELAGSRVIAIDSRRDAIDQISTALAGLSEIDVVRVISHGSDGSLWFGDQRIDATTLATRADEIAGWGRALSAGADMLLYGCSVASAGDGSQFVRALAGLTGADTAANSNHTGFAGDVTLDFQVGDVTHSLQATAECYTRADVTLCTRVLWNDNPVAVVAGRTADWFKAANPRGASDPKLHVMPRGLRKSGAMDGKVVVVSQNPAKWTSRFGSVVVGNYNSVVVDGMNEKGLAAHALALEGTNYGTRDVSRQGINMTLVVPYILDNAATVAEALALLPRIQPVAITMLGYATGLSFSIEDRLGDSAVIEYIEGVAEIRHGRQYRVVTNTKLDDAEALVAKFDFSNPTNAVTIPGNTHSTDRFVRASWYSNLLSRVTPRSRLEAQAALMSVMRNVSDPIGAPGSTANVVHETDWRTLSDLTNRVYVFENPRALTTLRTDLSRLDFRRGSGVRTIDPLNPRLPGDITRLYRPSRVAVPGVVGR